MSCNCNSYNSPTYPSSVTLGSSMSTSSSFTGNVLAVAASVIMTSGPTQVLPNTPRTAFASISGGSFPERHGFSTSAGTVQGGGPETNYSNKLGSMVSTNLRMINTNFLAGSNTGGELVYLTNQTAGGSSDATVLGSNNYRPAMAPGIEKQVKALSFLDFGTMYIVGTVASTVSKRRLTFPSVGVVDGGSGLTLKIISVGVGGDIEEIKIMNPGQGYEIGDKISVLSTGTSAIMIVSQLVPAHIRKSDCGIPDNTMTIHGNANYTFASFGNTIFPK